MSKAHLATSRSPLSAILLSLFVLSFSSTLPIASSQPSIVYGGCTEIKYKPGSPFQSNLNALLTSIVNSATTTSYNNFTITGLSPADVVYGLYQCRGDLSTSDCFKCIQSAVNQLNILCMNSCGATLQFQGCFIKYDNVTFIGEQDTTVVLKKCSPQMSYDNELFSRRDDVLAGLQTGSGGFRTAAEGLLQGMAQCAGDLSAGECSECLTQAIGKLRSDCGSSLTGDVYLGKCYARYSAAGFYSHAPPDSSKGGGAGKTVALIVGVMAGVVLIIVFLAFLRKAFSKGDGGKY